jgi:D-3-phosphoglycerate dehydrogenase
MFNIFCNDGLGLDIVAKLKINHQVVTTHYEKEALSDVIQHVDILVVRSKTIVDKALIDDSLQTKKLKLIIRAGVGLDNIDVTYCQTHHIKVYNHP